MPKKVLIIEDSEAMQGAWKEEIRYLTDEIEIISATDIEETIRLFEANPDIAAIAVDACVPGNEPNTKPLVLRFRRTFRGPMIAISGDELYRKDLMKAGCDYECVKVRLPRKLLEILNLKMKTKED